MCLGLRLIGAHMLLTVQISNKDRFASSWTHSTAKCRALYAREPTNCHWGSPSNIRTVKFRSYERPQKSHTGSRSHLHKILSTILVVERNHCVFLVQRQAALDKHHPAYFIPIVVFPASMITFSWQASLVTLDMTRLD